MLLAAAGVTLMVLLDERRGAAVLAAAVRLDPRALRDRSRCGRAERRQDREEPRARRDTAAWTHRARGRAQRAHGAGAGIGDRARRACTPRWNVLRGHDARIPRGDVRSWSFPS